MKELGFGLELGVGRGCGCAWMVPSGGLLRPWIVCNQQPHPWKILTRGPQYSWYWPWVDIPALQVFSRSVTLTTKPQNKYSPEYPIMFRALVTVHCPNTCRKYSTGWKVQTTYCQLPTARSTSIFRTKGGVQYRILIVCRTCWRFGHRCGVRTEQYRCVQYDIQAILDD